jgi:hypothetical protein
MKTVKILTHNHGIVSINVANDADTTKLAEELKKKYGEFIQLSVHDLPNIKINIKP